MKFASPQLLWALWVLLIPILVHLFQLRRFRKVAFTNVAFLSAIVLKTRQSSRLKKILILLCRMLALAGLVIAFSGPYISNRDQRSDQKETIIYLDHSFSMSRKGKSGSLLNEAKQGLLKNFPADLHLTLIGQSGKIGEGTPAALEPSILRLEPQGNSPEANAMLRFMKTFKKDKASDLIIITDDQILQSELSLPIDSLNRLKIAALLPVNNNNLFIDTLFIKSVQADQAILQLILGRHGDADRTQVSVYQEEQLLYRSAADFKDSQQLELEIPLALGSEIKGRISITDPELEYDNTLFFFLDKPSKPVILRIGTPSDSFLNKIYTPEDFEFHQGTPETLDYSLLAKSNLLILDQLKEMPTALLNPVLERIASGMKVVIIPGDDLQMPSYQALLKNLGFPTKMNIHLQKELVSKINFGHPLLSGVFESKTQNFQYPEVNKHFDIGQNVNTVLEFTEGTPFLAESDGHYLFTAALNPEQSNFTRSPLVVPVFFNIGKYSTSSSLLYRLTDQQEEIRIGAEMNSDEVLRLQWEDQTVIPQQRYQAGEVALQIGELSLPAGFFSVTTPEGDTLTTLALNHNRRESRSITEQISRNLPDYLYNEIEPLGLELKSENKVLELWKWFVIFALMFFIIEMLLIKLLK